MFLLESGTRFQTLRHFATFAACLPAVRELAAADQDFRLSGPCHDSEGADLTLDEQEILEWERDYPLALSTLRELQFLAGWFQDAIDAATADDRSPEWLAWARERERAVHGRIAETAKGAA